MTIALPDPVVQVGILCYKDAILAKKTYILSLCRLLLPLFGVFVILIIVSGNIALYSDSYPDVGPQLGDLPKCQVRKPHIFSNLTRINLHL
jgi:hypothetical protein